MELRVLGAHHLESAASRLVSLLIDGVLALDAGSLSSGLALEEQARLKAVLVTHYHFDHAKDLPLLGLATAYLSTTAVYAPRATLDFLSRHLFDGEIYPAFDRWPRPESPSLRLKPIEPLVQVAVEGYLVKAVPVKHGAVPAVGYEVIAADGASLFYTGDTGAGLSSCWEHTSPRLLAIEVSLPNSMDQQAQRAGHLTPGLLERELLDFRRVKGYLPQVLVLHLSPPLEAETARELAGVSSALGAPITIARQGMSLPV